MEFANDATVEERRRLEHEPAHRRWCETTEAGMPPSEVAEHVFEALRLDRFYILTHKWVKDVVRARMADIVEERGPTEPTETMPGSPDG